METKGPPSRFRSVLCYKSLALRQIWISPGAVCSTAKASATHKHLVKPFRSQLSLGSCWVTISFRYRWRNREEKGVRAALVQRASVPATLFQDQGTYQPRKAKRRQWEPEPIILQRKKRSGLPANNLEDCSLKRVGFNEILMRSITAR